MQKNDSGSLPHIIDKNKMACRHKCKTTKYLVVSIGLNYHDLGVGNGFWNMIPKGQATKVKKK